MCWNRPINAKPLPETVGTAVPPGGFETRRRGDAENAEANAPGNLNTEGTEVTEGSASQRLCVETAAPEKDGGALAHCGYEVLEDVPGGRFSMRLSTPFEGASVGAQISPVDASGRHWELACWIVNNRGLGWTLFGDVRDMGRSVAKAWLRSMALELRKLYCHRSQKFRKRAIARAKAERGAAE